MIWPRICPVCGEELPERGNRRVYVSWKRGFRLVHAGRCFEAIDAQQVLGVEPRERVSPVRIVQIRRLAQLLGRQDEGRELAHQPLEDVLPLMRRLANLDQPQVGGGLGDRRERPLLRRDQLRYDVRKIAHLLEVSAPPRTEVIPWPAH